MKFVLELLAKELERQNLLIAASENANPQREASPEYRANNPPIEHFYPNIYQLRDQLEFAIAFLKLHLHDFN
jgi:hypothetical protein